MEVQFEEAASVQCDRCLQFIRAEGYSLFHNPEQSIDFCAPCYEHTLTRPPAFILTYYDRTQQPLRARAWKCFECGCTLGGGTEWMAFGIDSINVIDFCLDCIDTTDVRAAQQACWKLLRPKFVQTNFTHIFRLGEHVNIQLGNMNDIQGAIPAVFVPTLEHVELWTSHWHKCLLAPTPEEMGFIVYWAPFLSNDYLFAYCFNTNHSSHGRVVVCLEKSILFVPDVEIKTEDDYQHFIAELSRGNITLPSEAQHPILGTPRRDELVQARAAAFVRTLIEQIVNVVEF